MYLIIDIGNSFVKLAVFQDDILKNKVIVELKHIVNEIKNLKVKYIKIQKAIISSVGRLQKHEATMINELLDLTILDHKTKLPFINLYETPKTLGVDRIALVCASIKKFPRKNALIIDAGTCITYDFVSSNNHYLGGAISPGIRMRYESLHNLTANLPLLDTEHPNSIIGSSTKTSIHSGIINGVLNEIDGNINVYLEKYPNLTVILTGGDSNFLSKQLKSSIFVNNNFLLEGLYYILQFNSD